MGQHWRPLSRIQILNRYGMWINSLVSPSPKRCSLINEWKYEHVSKWCCLQVIYCVVYFDRWMQLVFAPVQVNLSLHSLGYCLFLFSLANIMSQRKSQTYFWALYLWNCCLGNKSSECLIYGVHTAEFCFRSYKETLHHNESERK